MWILKNYIHPTSATFCEARVPIAPLSCSFLFWFFIERTLSHCTWREFHFRISKLCLWQWCIQLYLSLSSIAPVLQSRGGKMACEPRKQNYIKLDEAICVFIDMYNISKYIQNVNRRCMQLLPALFLKMVYHMVNMGNTITKVCLSFMGLTLGKRISLKVLHILWYL